MGAQVALWRRPFPCDAAADTELRLLSVLPLVDSILKYKVQETRGVDVAYRSRKRRHVGGVDQPGTRHQRPQQDSLL